MDRYRAQEVLTKRVSQYTRYQAEYQQLRNRLYRLFPLFMRRLAERLRNEGRRRREVHLDPEYLRYVHKRVWAVEHATRARVIRETTVMLLQARRYRDNSRSA